MTKEEAKKAEENIEQKVEEKLEETEENDEDLDTKEKLAFPTAAVVRVMKKKLDKGHFQRVK